MRPLNKWNNGVVELHIAFIKKEICKTKFVVVSMLNVIE